MATTFSRNSPLAGIAAESFVKTFEDELLKQENSYAVVLSQRPASQISGEEFSPMHTHNATNGLLAAILPEFSSIVGTKRWKWKPVPFTPWDSTKNMFGKQFYCDHRITKGVNSGAHGVWLCVDAPSAGGIKSTVPPSSLDHRPVKSTDGYTWKFLFLISGIERTFLDSEFLPVPKTISVNNEWKKFASSDPRLTNKDIELNSRKNLRGSISSLQITDYNIWSNLRWTNKPQFNFSESPGDGGREAKITPIMHYVTDTNNTDNQGWKITGFDITDRGLGYSPFAAYSLWMTIDPRQNQYSGKYTSEYVLGESRHEGQKTELLHASVFGSDGASNFRELLYANMLRIHVLITAEQVNDHIPSGTEISSVSLVQNPYIDGTVAYKKVKYSTPRGSNANILSAADKVTVSSSSPLDDGSVIRITNNSTSNKKGLGQVASSTTEGSSTTYTIVGGSNLDVALLYNVTTDAVGAVGLVDLSTPSDPVLTVPPFSTTTGAGGTTQTITSVSHSRISSGPETRVLGEFNYGATTVAVDEGILIKLTLGQDDNN